MLLFLATIYFVLFCFLAGRNFRVGLFLFILFLPTYFIRLSVGPLPTTILEITWLALLTAWISKFSRTDWPEIKAFFSRYGLWRWSLGAFFFASLISVFVSGWDTARYWPTVVSAFGIWRAFFLEPIILFIILIGRSQSTSDKTDGMHHGLIINALGIATVSVAGLAVLQKITGRFYSPNLWDDELSGRVTSFFSTPNAIGLLVAPIMFLLLAQTVRVYKSERNTSARWYYIVMAVLILALNLLAIIFSVSQGTWAALGAGALVWLWCLKWKKTALALAVGVMLAITLTPTLQTAFLFKDQAGKNRFTLWGYSWNYLSASPRNFIFGTGSRQFFEKIQQPFYNPRKLERIIYPHNIFLNFWTEIGLFGMLAFVGIVIQIMYSAKRFCVTDRVLGAGIMAALTALLVHGLVDVPYFKNDLAFLFWLVALLALLPVTPSRKIV